MTKRDEWDPARYGQFAAERAQPFHDLLALVQPVPGGSVVDLGCGTGQLTVDLHRAAEAATTVGIDSSPKMLDQAPPDVAGLRFELGDIADVDGAFDVVFANASLHWLPDHARLLRRLAGLLRPGGQLAVQVPANTDHASHVLANEVAGEPDLLEAMGGHPPPDVIRGVLAPEAYAELLAELGFTQQHVRLQVYGHWLPGVASLVDWLSGTTLVRFRSALPADAYEDFVERYRHRLVSTLGRREPYFYAFKRILLWARV